MLIYSTNLGKITQWSTDLLTVRVVAHVYTQEAQDLSLSPVVLTLGLGPNEPQVDSAIPLVSNDDKETRPVLYVCHSRSASKPYRAQMNSLEQWELSTPDKVLAQLEQIPNSYNEKYTGWWSWKMVATLEPEGI